MTETVAAPGLSTIYESVYSASGVAEGGWQAVALDAHGNASFSVNLAQSGDYVKAVDNLNAPAVTATSSAVTITDLPPAPTIALADLGATQEAAPGAGVAVTVSIVSSDAAPLSISPTQHDIAPASLAVSSEASLGSLPNQPATNYDRFALSPAQITTTYEKSTSVTYSASGTELHGTLANMLLDHLSKLGNNSSALPNSHLDHTFMPDHSASLSIQTEIHSGPSALTDAITFPSTNNQHDVLHHAETHEADYHSNYFG